MAYSPVGQGGKLLQNKVTKIVAGKHEMSPAQVALSWCMRKPVLAIPKAGSVEHVEENLQATNLVLGAGELEAIDRAFPPPRSKQPLAML